MMTGPVLFASFRGFRETTRPQPSDLKSDVWFGLFSTPNFPVLLLPGLQSRRAAAKSHSWCR